MTGKPEAEMKETELIAKARLYANRSCPGWVVGSLALWRPGRRKPKVIAFRAGGDQCGEFTAEGLKSLMRLWADCGPAWRACSVAFRIGELGELPLETLVVKNLLVTAY